jgi:nicotinamidase-related amidase
MIFNVIKIPKGGLKLERGKTALIVIDIQDVLMKQMDQEVARKTIKNIKTMINFAKEMGIPILLTEQYPKGLGRTIKEIQSELEPITPIEKLSFSCCGENSFNEKLKGLCKKYIIITGIETHVCILQTTNDLLEKGYEVHVVADAVCSRRKLDWEIALRWMEKKGAIISTTEIIAFQLLKEAGTEEFRHLSKLLK